jgi:NAD(P)-dependent dehydrogenase (short-subunit alcohol dehydrogenase family)
VPRQGCQRHRESRADGRPGSADLFLTDIRDAALEAVVAEITARAERSATTSADVSTTRPSPRWPPDPDAHGGLDVVMNIAGIGAGWSTST